VMFQDLLRSPEKYEDGVSDLLTSLVAGSRSLKSLSSEEKALLDRAVGDLSRPSLPRPSDSPKKSSETTEQKPSSEDSALKTKEASLEEQIPADLLPDEAAVPFWFL
jgi:hypothetical protein